VNLGFFELFAAGLAAFYAIVKSYGLSIILLTLAVRVLLLPLSIKQTRSMREMQVIQPEIKKIQAKYKGDRQKMNEAMMALYKEHGVNPFGGCAPLLLQFPVLIALFYVIQTPLKYVTPDALLASDLATRALDLNRFLGIRLDCKPSQVLAQEPSLTIPEVACGASTLSIIPYALMILFMGFTTYYQQKQMQATRGPADPQQQQMQMFMRIMPIMLMVFAVNFPTGVVLYWLTTNVWTIVQQRIILKAAPPIVGDATTNGKPAGKTAKKPTATAASGDAISTSANGAGDQTAAAAPSRPNPSKKKKKR